MTAADHDSSSSSSRGLVGMLLADRHFLVAAVILAASAAGWSALVEFMGWVTLKHPVPWPAAVVVDGDFRMTSLPDRIGPYAFVSGDGVMEFRDGQPYKDGIPDGRGEVPKETMELLKIGTGTDQSNLPRRRSNWYAIRTYEDTRVAPRQATRFWRLEVFYYTGGRELVPHVPEICAVMGGATYLRTTDLPVKLGPAPGPWNQAVINFQKALFQRDDPTGLRSDQFVQYYVFSLNGEPETDRLKVRGKLALPFVRYAYFAKIQFAPVPVFAMPDPAEADEAAKDFAAHFLPEVLKTLPMPEDVRKLDGAGDTGG